MKIIKEEDLVIVRFYPYNGTTVKHIPSGLSAYCNDNKHRKADEFTARWILINRLEREGWIFKY